MVSAFLSPDGSGGHEEGDEPKARTRPTSPTGYHQFRTRELGDALRGCTATLQPPSTTAGRWGCCTSLCTFLAAAGNSSRTGEGKNQSGQGLQSVSTFFLNSLGSSLILAGSALLHSNTPKPKETVPHHRSPAAGSPCRTKGSCIHPESTALQNFKGGCGERKAARILPRYSAWLTQMERDAARSKRKKKKKKDIK